MITVAEFAITDFSNDEIKAEYEKRFGADEASLDDFKSSELIDELQERGTLPEPGEPHRFEEIADLVAEAARTSGHALRAYGLMRDAFPALTPLAARQLIIAGRMGEVA